MNSQILPTFPKIADVHAASNYATTILADNTKGGEDLVSLTFVYQVLSTGAVKKKVLTNSLRAGDKATFTLPRGSDPTAFYILWRTGNFYRWFGESSPGKVFTEIEASWRVDDFEGMKVWGGGLSGSASSP